MFDPVGRLSAIWKLVANDAVILEKLALTGKTEIEKRKAILRRSQWTDLVAPQRRLSIYFRPSLRTRNGIIREETLQIDCHVAEHDERIAYEVLQRLRVLLHGAKIAGCLLEFDGQLGDLPTMPGFFSAGVRFNWFGVV